MLSAWKKNLLAFFGEGARVLPPSIEGALINAAKTRRSSGYGATYTKNKRDNVDSDNGIGRKRTKSDDEEYFFGDCQSEWLICHSNPKDRA